MPKGYRKDGTRLGFQKGQPAWNKDIEYTKEQISRLNLDGLEKGHGWNKGKRYPQFSGENSSSWKDGISKSKFYNRLCLFNRRYRKKYGPLTIETMQEVYEANIRRFGMLTCYLCLKPIEFGKDCLEHKIPLARGGTNDKANLDIAHKNCNLKKCNKTEEEYKIKLEVEK